MSRLHAEGCQFSHSHWASAQSPQCSAWWMRFYYEPFAFRDPDRLVVLREAIDDPQSGRSAIPDNYRHSSIEECR